MTDSTDPQAPELLDVLAPDEETDDQLEATDSDAPDRVKRAAYREWKRRGAKGAYYYRDNDNRSGIDLTVEELAQVEKCDVFDNTEALPSRKVRTMHGAEGRFRVPSYARNQLARGFKVTTGVDSEGDTYTNDPALGAVSNRSAHDYWPTFVRDVFGSMYGMPKAENGLNEPAWAREMLDAIEGDENIKAIRRGAKLDPDVALEASKRILNSIQSPAPESDKQLQDRESGKEQKSVDPSKMGPRQARKADQASEAMRQAMQKAAEQAQKATDKAKAQASSEDWGGDTGEDYGQSQGFAESHGYASLNTRFRHIDPPQIEKVSEIAGRAMSTAYNSRAKNAAAPGGITDVECGRDIRQWLPAELALLANPETEMLALSRYAERSALQFKTEGDDDMGRGPIVLFVDLSSSMHCSDIEYRGDRMARNVWAAGVAMALWQVATWQGRDCRLIGYTGSVCYDYLIDSEEKAAEILSREYSGGTSLGNAISYVKNKGYDKRADFVIVSDGEDWGWEGPAKAAKRERDVRLHAVAISGEWDQTEELESYTHVNGSELDLSDQYAAL